MIKLDKTDNLTAVQQHVVKQLIDKEYKHGWQKTVSDALCDKTLAPFTKREKISIIRTFLDIIE